MKPISRDNLDEMQWRAIHRRMDRFRFVRIGFFVVFFALLMLTLVGDHSAWRFWMLGSVVFISVAQAGVQFMKHAPPMPPRDSPWVALGIFVNMGAFMLATGGFDSPILPFVIPVCVGLGAFTTTRTLIPSALALIALTWTMAFVSSRGLIVDLIPAVFGGGSHIAQPASLLYAKACTLTFGLIWAASASRAMRQVFREIVGDALDARDEVLKSHDAQARELTALSGELAHELKNPLANIKSLAVLVGRDLEGKAAERLRVLQHEVVRMQEILENFLTFSRPLVPLSQDDVDLKDLCESALALHEGTANARSVSLESRALISVPASCDARKVTQILINLVQNALEASPRGGTVEMALFRASGGGRVEIRDRGLGISEAVRAHLFEPGWTTKERGSGLGLALARGLARQHGGDLSLENREDGGCTAVLTLPLSPRPALSEGT